MRGQYLLQQRTAGARHADDEYRIVRRRARTRQAAEQTGAAVLLLSGKFPRQGVGVVVTGAALESVALGITGKGVGEIPPILERFSQGEAEENPIRGGEVGILQKPVHYSNIAIVKAVGLQIGERIPGFAVMATAVECSPVGGDCSLAVATGFQSMAARGQGNRVARYLL